MSEMFQVYCSSTDSANLYCNGPCEKEGDEQHLKWQLGELLHCDRAYSICDSFFF
jgi:hypothetical protein